MVVAAGEMVLEKMVARAAAVAVAGAPQEQGHQGKETTVVLVEMESLILQQVVVVEHRP